MISHGDRPAIAVTAGERASLRDHVEARCAAGEAYFAANAVGIAECAAAMADRFFRGATLLVMGSGGRATDAQHNSVEFVHPGLPGCRALAAISLNNSTALVTGFRGDRASDIYAHQLLALGDRDRDIALGFAGAEDDPAVRHGLQRAADMGLQTIVLTSGGESPALDAEHVFHVRSDDELIAQELHLATYHMLWELVHIVLNHRGIVGDSR